MTATVSPSQRYGRTLKEAMSNKRFTDYISAIVDYEVAKERRANTQRSMTKIMTETTPALTLLDAKIKPIMEKAIDKWLATAQPSISFGDLTIERVPDTVGFHIRYKQWTWTIRNLAELKQAVPTIARNY